MAELTLPVDKIQTPISQLQDKDLQFWVKRIPQDLEKDPNGRFAKSNREKLEAVRAELARRNGGGAAAPAAQRQAAPQSTAMARTSAPTALAKTPTNVATISLDRIANDPQAVTARLAELSESYHLVSPATAVDTLPPGFGVAVSFVQVNPSTEKDGPGDVVPIGGKLMLSANSLARVAAAAAIDWDPSRSGRLDSGKDPHYCHFRAVGFVRNFDGSVRTLTGEVEVDAREGSPQIDEIREKARKREQEHPDWKNDGGASQILELRKFLLRHAERKAKNRAIVDMGVKRSYSNDEIKRPFAVARLVWTGQSDDPELRREFARMGAERMLSGTAALYGAQQAPALPAPAGRARPALPRFTGHEPPPVGSVVDDPSDYGGYDVDGYGEEVEATSPTAAQPLPGQPVGERVGEPVGTHALPPDQDRGADPNAY